MKKFTLIIAILLLVLRSEAQDYMISFAGTGDTTSVNTVKVENLTSGITVLLNGEDILHLVAPVGIDRYQISAHGMSCSPNPMADQSTLAFYAKEKGNVSIRIIDVFGKIITQCSMMLSPGLHSFRVSGLKSGIYMVSATGKNYNYSTKIQSIGNIKNNTKIEYVSALLNSENIRLKSTSNVIEMPYANSDLLILKGVSGKYSTVIPLKPTSNTTVEFQFVACTDNHGKSYPVIQIGSHTWMAENLAYLPKVSPAKDGSITLPFYYVYDYNDSIVEDAKQSDNYRIYGVLYNWAAAKGSCPIGWHLPDDEDWISLEMALGMSQTETTMANWRNSGSVGRKLRDTNTTYWGNNSATNESGFTALPGGLKSYDFFDGINRNAIFWSSSENNDKTYAIARYLSESWPGVSRSMEYKLRGYSVRCVRD